MPDPPILYSYSNQYLRFDFHKSIISSGLYSLSHPDPAIDYTCTVTWLIPYSDLHLNFAIDSYHNLIPAVLYFSSHLSWSDCSFHILIPLNLENTQSLQERWFWFDCWKDQHLQRFPLLRFSHFPTIFHHRFYQIYQHISKMWHPEMSYYRSAHPFPPPLQAKPYSSTPPCQITIFQIPVYVVLF